MARSLQILLTICLAFVTAAKGSLPEDLSNFQNEYVCDTEVRLVRPRSIADVQAAVKLHAHVKASGTGCSWNKEFFCSLSPTETEQNDDTSANIVTTTIRPLSIYVDEEDMFVWVSAGVTVWDLMAYLRDYITPSAPRGYSIGAYANYVNQTIAGAVATGTHGSSLTFGSQSNLAIGFRVVLANGTMALIEPDTHPLYFKAFQVSVGRLGVVTDVKLRIIRETVVRRTLHLGVPRSDMVSRITDAQEQFRSTGTLPSWLDFTQIHYRPTDETFEIFSVEENASYSDEPLESETDFALIEETHANREQWFAERMATRLNITGSEYGSSVASGVEWEVPPPLEPDLVYEDASNTAAILEGQEEIFLTSLNNATLERHVALLGPAESTEIELTVPYDDYEVAVPVDKMADCLEGFLDLLDQLAPEDGLRVGGLLRLVGQETGLLSVSHDKPHIWFALPDYVYYNQETRQPNLPFRSVMEYLVTSPFCSPARLHWGKAGWPDQGCWNGAELFGKNWCDFGCAVRDLDPNGKFIGSAPDMWNWDGANLDQCCTEDGYDTALQGCACSVIPRYSPQECPEAPFYSSR